MKVTEYVLKAIKSEGVNDVFLYPGANIATFLWALSEHPELNSFVACHEEGAAFMADGYARAGGKFGVVFAIAGPGITNTTTAIATSHSDDVPVLAISGETPTQMEGRGGFQDAGSSRVSSMKIFESITSFQANILDPIQLKPQLSRLFRFMVGHEKRGPALLAIPGNVLKSDAATEEYWKLPEVIYQPRFVDKAACQEFWTAIKDAKKVAILAGRGSLDSNASDELLRFIERFEIPVATTLAAKGMIPEDHPLSLGLLGWFGNRPAIEGLTSGDVEVLIVLGSRLSILDTVGWKKKLQPKKILIVNDINTNSIFCEYRVGMPILGDAREFLKTLNELADDKGADLASSNNDRKKWLADLRAKGDRCYRPEDMTSDQIPINPARVTGDLRKVMPRDTVLFVDTGAHAFIASHYWLSYAPRQFFSSIKYMAPMGWAIAAVIGSKILRPNLPHVAIVGDGCMQMHGMEISTSARYNKPVIYVVINNSAIGNTKLAADNISKKMADMLVLPTHDWTKFAESMGAIGMRVEKPEDLVPAFEKALALNKTVVIDVITGNYPTPTESFDEEIARGFSNIQKDNKNATAR